LTLIRGVSGYSRQEGKRVDQRREHTRVGEKKPVNVSLSRQQAHALVLRPDTPQGRRDALLVHLLLEHGLRVGELARLRVEDIDLSAGAFTFFRPKVDKVQTHRMTAASARAVQRWFTFGDAPASGLLLRGSRKGGHLSKPGMSERAITARVRYLGEEIGISGLSAHDCRHYWATTAARHGTDAFVLRDAGGWNSIAMPSRYVEGQKVANEGVNLGAVED
jgi:integrase